MNKETENQDEKEILEKMINDQEFRINVTSKSPYWFFLFYFTEYIKHPISDMHREMLEVIQDQSIELAVITAFRGSGKSTLFTTLAPIWSVLGKPQSKFVVIASQTRQQVKQHFSSLKKELENNRRLKQDLGPFEDKTEEWGQYGVYLKKYDARIMAVSREQSIRGIRHGSSRPDLIICDDVEDLESVKTMDSRKKTYRWFKGDLLPAGDQNTRMIVVGTPLHQNSLVKRLEEEIKENKTDGIALQYPIIDESDNITWPGKYPNKGSILRERKKIANEIDWRREYMLEIIPEEDQVIHRGWIKFYENNLHKKWSEDYLYTYVGIDLAISKKDSADFTAMVAIDVYRKDRELAFVVHPNPVNQRLNFNQTLSQVNQTYKTLNSSNRHVIFVVEDVGYQKATIEQIRRQGSEVIEFKVSRQDKRSRLMSASSVIQQGQVLFPKKGSKQLVEQIVGFGIEKHDDLADAFTSAVLAAIEENDPTYSPMVFFV